jgi:hypothetical protein
MSQTVAINGRVFEEKGGKIYLDGNQIIENQVSVSSDVNKYIALGMFLGVFIGFLIGRTI